MSLLTPQGDLARPTQIQIDLATLRSNIQNIQASVGSAMLMPAVKANAYGHGLVQITQHLQDIGIRHVCVALLEEGLQLRQAGITLDILVLGGLLPQQIPHYLANNLILTAASLEKLTHIEAAAAAMGVRARVHLKIDTGMERVGVHWYHAAPFLTAAAQSQHCVVEGVYSHFANADALDLSSAQAQLAHFQEALSFYEKNGLPCPTRHIANSGGILQLPESHLDLVRPGILIYGVYPGLETRQTIAVQPILQLKSQVVYFKVVEANSPISYGHTWQTDHRIRVVTVPIGYGDGYPRSLSNKAQVLIRGKRYPVAGRVCMDQLMVNIEWDEAYNGDAVTLIGRDGDEVVSVYDVANWLETIPYEVLTNLNTRIPRRYFGETHADSAHPCNSQSAAGKGQPTCA